MNDQHGDANAPFRAATPMVDIVVSPHILVGYKKSHPR